MGKNVALVLSSGGARGIAQIGAINELKKNGFEITSISGSSIGALVGGICAMGKLDEFTAWVSSLNRKDIFSIMDFTISTHGILKVEKLFRIMEKDFPDVMIEDLSIPYVVMATDVANNREVAFTSGSIYKAVRASIAIPAIITSVHDKNQVLVDGAVLNPIPIRQIKRTDNDIVVVINLYALGLDKPFNDTSTEEIIEDIDQRTMLPERFIRKSEIVQLSQKILNSKPNIISNNHGYITLLNKVITMMLQTNASSAIQLHKPDIVINIPRSSAGTFDFHKSEELIEIGRVAAMKSIQTYMNSLQ